MSLVAPSSSDLPEYRENADEPPVDEDMVEEVNEDPIRHNVYPDTSSNEDEEEAEHVSHNYARPESFGESMLVVGQVFYDSEDIKNIVLDHALAHRRNIRQTRYDKNMIEFSCFGGNCSWRVWCAIRSHGDKWEVMSYNKEHGCVPNGECHLLKIPVIARLFIHKIKSDPNYYMPMKLQEIIKGSWNISVSRDQCQKARIMALKKIEEWYDEQFKRLKDYALEVMESNPNSSVEVEKYTNVEGLEVFNRFYVCYDALRRNFRNHCRPLIGVNGCFLKGKMKGILLVALGRDGNNSIYPFAWAIVQREDTDNWRWFFNKLKVDLNLADGEGYVLVSDRQKRLCNAVEIELPKIDHRMCVRHIYENLKKKHWGIKELKPLVWHVGWSYNEAEYRENMRKIYMCNTQLHKDVLEKRPKTWCRVFHTIGSCSEDVTNNSTESFNATIMKARELPLVPLLELISRQAMVRIVRRSFIALNHTGRCTPYTADVLAELHPKAAECIVWPGTNQTFLVQAPDCSYTVSLPRRACSCRKWDLRGIPCEHAYAVMLEKNIQVEDYVVHWFWKTTWIQTYEDGILPTRGAKFWPHSGGPDIHRPPSPDLPGRKKMTTEKKQKRKKAVNESPTKKASKVSKRKMHCSICQQAGHNIKGHRKRLLASQSQGDCSLVIASQSQGECSQSQGDGSLTQLDLAT